MSIAAGTTIDRYRIESSIGAGSMGDVFRGVDVDLNRKVAVKILSDRHRDNPELRARFVREARAVAAISHRNVVQVFTTGTFDERPYIAMEFLDGTDLGSAVEDGGRLSSLAAARAILDAARGLDAAAKAGLIHRDVKPSNLVMLVDGTVKVTDFGLAKPVDPGSEPSLTALGVVVGTPDYIAPEQARGDAIDERVDIYALGGTLFFLITGAPPFRTGNAAEDKYLKVVARHLKAPPPDPRTTVPRCDPELADLTKQMMAKKSSERPGYDELIDRLAAIVTRLASEQSGAVPLPDRSITRSADGSGGRVAPTPFVGGDAPRAFTDEDAAPTNLRMPTRPPIEEVVRPTRTRPPTGGGGGDLGDGGASLGGDGASLSALPTPRVSRALIAVTVLSLLVFVTGLSLFLFGPVPSPDRGAGSGSAVDAGAAVVPPPIDAAPKPPEPVAPAGMVLVRRADGTPWFFVDQKPVSHAEYATIFRDHKKPSGAAAKTKPVTGVAFTFARAFATSSAKRLLKADEWEAARATEGFEPAGGNLWEWVDDPAPSADQRTVVQMAASGLKKAKRQSKAHGDVTFRMARDL